MNDLSTPVCSLSLFCLLSSFCHNFFSHSFLFLFARYPLVIKKIRGLLCCFSCAAVLRSGERLVVGVREGLICCFSPSRTGKSHNFSIFAVFIRSCLSAVCWWWWWWGNSCHFCVETKRKEKKKKKLKNWRVLEC